MSLYNTFVDYVGDGTTTDFPVPFTYIDTSDVVVTVGGTAATFTFLNPNTVRVTPAPTTGTGVRVARSTAISAPRVSFANGSSTTAKQLNTALSQLLNALQESIDRASATIGLLAGGVGWDMQNKRLVNVLAPTQASDAATKQYVDTVASLPGPQGPQGTVGPAGPNGPQGPTGLQGPAGPQGPVGTAGPQGSKGDTGPAGPQGIQGTTGATGATGPQGPTGANGPAGPTGATGATGPTGPQGDSFHPDVIASSSLRSGYDGQATGFSFLSTDLGAISFKNSATSGDWSAWVPFGVGPTGPSGPTGATGPAGPTGATGPAGPTGPTGPTGATGPQGPQGTAGATGAQGTAGAAGAVGMTYRGAYSSGTTYVQRDVVVSQNSSWILTTASSTGNAPPTLPTLSNTNWGIVAVGVNGAAGVTFTPTGNVASTDVQSAIAEVDSEKLAKANNLSDVNSATAALANLGVTLGTAANNVPQLNANGQLDPSVYGVNECGRFVWTDANTVTYIPFKGNKVRINGKWYTIPSAGVAGVRTNCYVAGVAAQTLANSTAYFVYLFDNAGTLTLDFSTTGHSTDATYGTEIKTGDATRTLVGWVKTSSSGTLVDGSEDGTSTSLWVLSWFNRRTKTIQVKGASSPSTTSSTYISATSALTLNYGTWSKEAAIASANITLFAGANQFETGFASIGFDSVAPASDAPCVSVQTPATGENIDICASVAIPLMQSEGAHSSTIYMRGSVTILGSLSYNQITVRG